MAQAAVKDEGDVFADTFAQIAVAAEKQVQAAAKVDEPAKEPAKTGGEVTPAAGDTTGGDGVVTSPAAKSEEEIAAQKKADDEAAAKTAAEAAATKAAADQKTVSDAAALLAANKVAEDAAAQVKETAAQTKAREELEAKLAPYEPTDDEKAALEVFKRDFPNEFKGMESRLKGVDKDIDARVYRAVQAVLKQVNEAVTPVIQQSQQQSVTQHVSAIRTAHADYETVVPKIPEWIKTQPALLRPAYQAAYDQGDSQMVIDLIAAYKGATGTPANTGKTADQIAAEAAAVAKAKAAADDAASLLPVGSKRTNTEPKGAADKTDYDGAWAELSAATK